MVVGRGGNANPHQKLIYPNPIIRELSVLECFGLSSAAVMDAAFALAVEYAVPFGCWP